MSLDDKIAQIMSGNFVPPVSPLARTTPVTVFKSERVLSPISSPISRGGNALGSFGSDSPTFPGGMKSPSPLPSDRVKSPYTGLADATQQSAKTLEEMLSAYRASKGESNPSGTISPTLAPSAAFSSPRGSTEGIAILKEDPARSTSIQSVFPLVSTGGNDGDVQGNAKEASTPLRTVPIHVAKTVVRDPSSSQATPAIEQPHSLRGEMEKLRMASVDDNEEEEGVVVITEENMHQLERQASKVDVPRAMRQPIAPVSSLIGGDVEVTREEPVIQPDSQPLSQSSTPPLLRPESDNVDPFAQTISTTIPPLLAVREVLVTQPSMQPKVVLAQDKQRLTTLEEKIDMTKFLTGTTEPQQPQQQPTSYMSQPSLQEIARGTSDEIALLGGTSTPPAVENSPPKRQGGRVAKPPNAKSIQTEVLVREEGKVDVASAPASVVPAPAPAPASQKISAKPEHAAPSVPKEQLEAKTPFGKKHPVSSSAPPTTIASSKSAATHAAATSKSHPAASITPSKPAPAPSSVPPKPVPPMMSTPIKETPRKPMSTALYTPGTGIKSSSNVLQVNPVNARPIKLAVRVRPFSDFEQAQHARRTIAKGGMENEVVVVNPNAFDANPDSVANAAKVIDNKQWAQSFRFDQCLWRHDADHDVNTFASQEEVHETLGLDIVDNVLNGVSCSCFAYGHTSTGKTYSLFGESGKRGNSKSAGITSESGLVPRVFRDIITAVKVNRVIKHGSRIFFSYLEVYNERVIDLLDDVSRAVANAKDIDTLKVREHPAYGPYVEGLKKIEIFSVEDMYDLIAKCQKKRASTQTAWNSHSSRSHAVVTLEVTNADLAAVSNAVDVDNKQEAIKRAISAGSMRKSELDAPVVKVQMVDLAGSEKDSLREDEESSAFLNYADSTPAKLSEAVEREKNELKLIRRSLATLGFIIQSLAKGAVFRSLPYRDSVLTFLLRDALNGFNHTTMLATISPAHLHYEETLSTLRYAEKLTLVRKKNSQNSEDELLAADLETSREEQVEEFRSFHSDVKKGSLAARQMLQYTVTDPRQRIAKLTQSSSQQLIPVTPKAPKPLTEVTFTSPIDGRVKRLTDLNGDDLDHLQSSYRNLQGQLIEMQIDLDAIKTDRDTLLVELRAAKEQLNDVEQSKDNAEGKMYGALKALKAAEKELAEHRMLLRRKEENIERLLADLSEQKQARLSAEQAYHARTKEFLARFDTLKRYVRYMNLSAHNK
ncbi:hypothetical protein EON65_32365 [archaeon]|nr:MAG: hypothetical protein EON65_32365 [archaeon]